MGQGTGFRRLSWRRWARIPPCSRSSCRNTRREALLPRTSCPPPSRPDAVLPGNRGSEKPQALPEVTWGLGLLRG